MCVHDLSSRSGEDGLCMAGVESAGVPSSGVCDTGIDRAFMSVPITFTCVGRGGIVTAGVSGVFIRGGGYRGIFDGIAHNAATS